MLTDAPQSLRAPKSVNQLNFKQLATHAIAGIPHRFLDEMHNRAVVVESEPSREFLEETNTEPHGRLHDLYQGTTLFDRKWAHGNSLPNRIITFQEPIVVNIIGDDAIARMGGEAIIDELGHYCVLTKQETWEIESQIWLGEGSEK